MKHPGRYLVALFPDGDYVAHPITPSLVAVHGSEPAAVAELCRRLQPAQAFFAEAWWQVLDLAGVEALTGNAA